METGAPAEADAERRHGQLTAEQVEGAGAGGGHRHLDQPVRAHQLQHRQGEDVERHLVAENRVGRAERLGVQPAEVVLP